MQAKVIIVNSDVTRRDVIEHLGVDERRVHTIYYGIDREKFRPASAIERRHARRNLGWSSGTPVVAFIGALGDRRKGLDKIFTAWQALCADPKWDVDLAIIGTGAELSTWKSRAAQTGLGARVHFLGFRDDVPLILAACDALVAPTRYEAYGQGVHEALCCDLPAFVTSTAGIAERYPDDLSDLLLGDPPEVTDIAHRLRLWRANRDDYSARVARFGAELRERTWTDMSREIHELILSS